MSESQEEIIRNSPMGADLSEDECKILSGIMRSRELTDGEIIFHEGDTDEMLWMLNSGRLAVTRDVGGGEHVNLHVMQVGSLVGEMAFVDGRPHSATVRALGDARVFELSRADFESQIEAHPMLVYKVMRSIIRVVHDTLMRMNQQHVEMANYISKAHGRY